MGEKRENRIRNQYRKTAGWFPGLRLWHVGAMVSGVLLLMGAWFWWGHADSPLGSSTRDYAALKQKVRSLQKKNQRLHEQNQTLRNKNQMLLSRLSSPTNASGTYIEQPRRARSGAPDSDVRSDSLPVEGPGEGEKLDPSMWIQVVGVSYPIRSERLREPIIYRAGSDDTLTKLAHQYYHDSRFWREIYEFNRDRLSSPDRLPPGTKLRLPPLTALNSSS